MHALKKAGNVKLQDEVYVYGNLRQRFSKEHFNFIGRKAIVKGVSKKFVGYVWVEMPHLGGKNFLAPLDNIFVNDISGDGLKKLQFIFEDLRKHDTVENHKLVDPYAFPENVVWGYWNGPTRTISVPSSVTQIGFVAEDGDVMFSSNTACHAGMGCGGTKKLAYLVSYIVTKGEELTEAGKAYYTWLFNHSNWAECFITKTWEEGFKSGIVLNVEQPYNLVGGAGIATRIPTEHPTRCEMWHQFVLNGMDPNRAFMSAIHFIWMGGNIYYNSGCGHLPLDCQYFYSNEVKNFLMNTPSVIKPIYSTNRSYGSVTLTWQTNNSNARYNNPEVLCMKINSLWDKLLQNTEGTATNPFGVVARSIKVERIAELTQVLDKMFEEMLNG